MIRNAFPQTHSLIHILYHRIQRCIFRTYALYDRYYMLYISYIQICDLRYILFRSSVRRYKKPAVECLYILEIVQIFSNVVEIPEAVLLKILPAEI